MKKIIIFLCSLVVISILIVIARKMYIESKSNKIKKEINTIVEEEIKTTKQEETKKFNKGIIGILRIPKLEVEAVIKEGTSKEILKYTIRTF